MEDDSTAFNHAGLWIIVALGYMILCAVYPWIAAAVFAVALVSCCLMSAEVMINVLRKRN